MNDQLLPVATFYLDTTIQLIEEEAYYDSTGTIINKNSLNMAILPDDTTWMINKRYSDSAGGIIDANGYALFLIPCPGDGVTQYSLQIKKANVDLERRKSTLFLFDSEQQCIGGANGSRFFSEMSNVEKKEDGSAQVNFVPTEETAYILVSIEAKIDTPISVLDINDYEILLKADDIGFEFPDGTIYMINQHYSESKGGIIDANGFASFMVLCIGDGITSYILQIRNAGLDISAQRTSRCFLLDAEKNLVGWTNGSAFFWT